MLIVRFEENGEIHYGIIEGDAVVRLNGSPYGSIERTSHVTGLSKVRLLCPVVKPRIFGVGLNYVEHIEESGSETPKIPLLFMKPSSAAIGPDESVIYPQEAKELHFEAEMAVVMGKKARRVREADALNYVLGYTCANDISERTIQSDEMAMGSLLIGKGYDTFCPIGPAIATELDPDDMQLGARINGVTRQSSSTADLLFSVAELVAYLSSAITLEPGDIILTGTPSGVGPVEPGDKMEIFIKGIGVLTNCVIKER